MQEPLIAWSDILKLLAGFGVSLVLIWAKSEGERLLRFRTLKRSAWNVAKHHTDYSFMIKDLEETAAAVDVGRVWISAVDISTHYSKVVSELATLDPKHSDIYLRFLGAEEVVREGYRNLRDLRAALINARSEVPSPPSEAISLKRCLKAQCLALKKDLKAMAEKERAVLQLIQIRRSDSIDPMQQLDEAIKTLDELTRNQT